MSRAPHRRTDLPEFFSRKVRVARRYYLDLSPPSGADLVVVCGGYEECAPNYRVKRDGFPYFGLEWTVRGRGRLELNGRKHTLSKGSIFTYGPGIAHDIQTDASAPLAKHFVCFVGDSAAGLLAKNALSPPAVGHAPPGIDLPWIFESLRRDGESGNKSAIESCSLLLNYLLVKLATTPAAPEQAHAGAHATYSECDEYLVENARHLTSLGELAGECGIDETYLCRLYKRFTSETPYQRLKKLKMQLAADELVEGECSIKETALNFGFTDPFHFSRTFKSVFGVSPSEFRRLH